MASSPYYVLGLDPGPTESALVVWDTEEKRVELNRFLDNSSMLATLKPMGLLGKSPLVIEQVVSYGMAVGKEVFETVYWSGIFAQAYGLDRVHRLPRLAVKLHLCGDSRAKDANIRRALLDRWPAGNKAKPGPLWGIKSHMFSALAVAVTWAETPRKEAA